MMTRQCPDYRMTTYTFNKLAQIAVASCLPSKDGARGLGKNLINVHLKPKRKKKLAMSSVVLTIDDVVSKIFKHIQMQIARC